MAQWNHAGALLEPALDPVSGRWTAEEPWIVAELGELRVGERIRELRRQRGWSAQRLADECAKAGTGSLQRSAIAKVENGLRRLRADEARTIARVLDVPTDDLIEPEPDGSDSIPDRADRAKGGRGTAGERSRSSADGIRRDELDQIISALGSARGPHFWLVTAPPRLGKTTLLTQLSDEMENAATGWATNLVDLREQAPEVREDPAALLAGMFGVESPVADDPAAHRGIAQRLSRQGKPYLCLLDSAEGMSRRTARMLRSSLSGVYHFVERTGNPDVRLAFVVASRLDEGWRGVTPDPRLAVLPVGEFGVDVVEDRLRELAGPARAARYSPGQFSDVASVVHRVTAGLPALLDPVLGWIRDEEWLDTHRLDSHEVFESLAGPYIQNWLLAPDSLFPGNDAVRPEQLQVLREAIEVLVRYRFFTQSHVRHHFDDNHAFDREFKESGWEVEDLWAALSGMTLLTRPLDEPWQEFHPAIRRLLYRHSYACAAQRAAAHREAKSFMSVWAGKQSGKDQVIGLVEGLWHHAEALRLERSSVVGEKLRKNASELAGALRGSDSYSAADLRSYAADRIIADVELQEAIGDVDGLADELIEIVTARE